MRVLVCGGRDYGWMYIPNHPGDIRWAIPDQLAIELLYSKLNELGLDIHVIAGGATGADSLAEMWADEFNVPITIYRADWKRYGKRAGYLRNKQMLDEGKPDLVIAFPGGKGTAMMVKIAQDAGVEVIEVEYNRE